MKDIIVVGAGPVGSHLAKKMAEKDNDVLVLERSNEIGKPLACSGHVSPDIKDFLSKNDFDEIFQNEIKEAIFHSGKKNYSFYSQEVVSYVIDRVELDKKKAFQAKNSGAEIKLGETVEKVEEKENKVVVKTDKKEYEASVVAGCDGASSTVRDEVGIKEPDHFYQGILCFTDEEDSSDNVDVLLDVPKFFGWRIPRGDSVEYGAAVPKGKDPMKWLEKVTEKFNVKEEDRNNLCAGAIPIRPPEKVSTDRVFLVGDSAGQTKPFTGGGILYGMRSAEIAGEKIDPDNPDLEKYEEAWRKELKTDIFLGSFIERVYSLPGILQRLGLWFFQGEIGVHMDRPTSLISKKQLKAMLPFV